MAGKSKHFEQIRESVLQMRAIERGEMKPTWQYTATEVLGASS